MAAKGGKFTSGGSPTKANAVTSKPTSKGFSVRNRSAGTTKTVTTSTPTVIVSSDNGVVTGVSGTGSRGAKRRAVRARRATIRRSGVLAPVKTPRAKKASQRVTPQPVLRQAKAKAIAVKAPKTKPVEFEGHKTAGTPTLKELQTGSKSKTLKVNEKGFVTTAPVRRAAKRVKKLQAKARKSSGPLPGLNSEQAKNARTVLRVAEKRKVTPKEKLAAVETGLVESGFTNYTDQAQTDLDSLGWRQERTSQYGTGPATSVRGGAHRFFDESISDTGGTRGAGMTAGQLAQTIQGSAFPERYDERRGDAKAILRAYNKGGLKPAERKKLVKAKGEAKELGLSIGKEPKGKVTKQQMTRFKAGQAAAKELNKAKLPYVWGGGHGDPASRPTGGGLDCSGAVSYVLNKMGALKGSLVSGDMGSALEPGPGAVTVFYNPTHTFMRIGKRYFGTSATNAGGGAGFIEGTPDDLSKYSVGHVPGMGKKVAVALGVPLAGGSTSFPGMTLSSSGTSATINSGAGATVGKPGFSNKPIKLTPAQKARRKLKKLDDLKVGQGTPTTQTDESAPSTSVLEELERKYSVAA